MGLLFTLLGGAAVNSVASEKFVEPQAPVYSLTVALGDNQRDAFFSRLERFSYANGFADRIAPTTRDGGFLITMWREDIKIYATNSFNPVVFRFLFYRNEGREVQYRHLELLVDKLKTAIGEVPDTQVTDERKYDR